MTTNGKRPNGSGPGHEQVAPATASELNNLLQIVSSTVSMLENVWEGAPGSERYFEMLRVSVDRAAKITAQLVQQVGGSEHKILLHPALAKPVAKARPAPRAPLKVSRGIMVVDDEPMALGLTQQVLADAGYAAVTAQSGFEALDLFRKDPQQFSLILLDLSMPFMDGEETFSRLRAIDPEVVVLLNTGFVEQDQLDRMMANGLAGFLSRPYREREVIQQIELLLARTENRAHPAATPPLAANSFPT